jgi:hypothetical protein
VSLLGVGVSLPTKVDIDVSVAVTHAQAAWQLGIEYAFASKRYLADWWTDYAPLLHSLYQQAADLVR